MPPRFTFRPQSSSAILTLKRQYYFAVSIFVLFVLWYLLSANAVVSTSYRLSDTIGKREALMGEIETLRATIVLVTKPEALEERARELGFRPVRDPIYLAVPGTTIAVRAAALDEVP